MTYYYGTYQNGKLTPLLRNGGVSNVPSFPMTIKDAKFLGKGKSSSADTQMPFSRIARLWAYIGLDCRYVSTSFPSISLLFCKISLQLHTCTRFIWWNYFKKTNMSLPSFL